MSVRWFDVIDQTWPAADQKTVGGFTLREGQGGGSRVSAATTSADGNAIDIDAAEQAMLEMGQERLFMIRPGDEELDAQLEARGYDVVDAVTIYACPAEKLTDMDIPRVTIFTIWEPLSIMREIWAEGGIGPARLDVMERVKGPKTGLLARFNDKRGGAGFVGIHDGIAMLHALEIVPFQRKQGLAKWMMRGAAFWALDNGAETLSVMCTKANEGANALYRSLGMDPVSEYHYRHLV
ncbi:GNAT family N-acetyltransferase [Phaeobacter gallaeciensis]|uniref:GNAT family N-acetyltransferase n=2 Tax=Roseobacteraceae TaxID=2854170 RepID=A0A366WYK8_9RHOB|nr:MULTISPECIES: GNAT family N-acetyltransferase [Roseobacteraceae]MBT3141116.1 GNAT family N-acetyltransferase [Falsiruegeria litorea]RBW54557.1 GNAT family N-acetyltransferase [Phaeobacter gallaeciensis]